MPINSFLYDTTSSICEYCNNTIDRLAVEILKVLEEEIAYRPYILEQGNIYCYYCHMYDVIDFKLLYVLQQFLFIGIRDISATVDLPPNSFDVIDLVAADYDDMRRCCICKHICVFTAIACECNKAKVACIRHFQALCQCSKKKKYLLGERTY
jgi:hypothetical protein